VRDFRFYAGNSHNLIGQGIFHGDQKSRDLHEKSRDQSNYEIFQYKILKSQSFKKRAVYLYFYATMNIFSQCSIPGNSNIFKLGLSPSQDEKAGG
jgi:hypothetical protein